MYSINIWLSHSVVLINHWKYFLTTCILITQINLLCKMQFLVCLFFHIKMCCFDVIVLGMLNSIFGVISVYEINFCLFHFWNPSKLFANFWGKYLANKNFKKMFSFILCCICCPIRQALEYLFIGMFTMNTVCISKKYTFLCTKYKW